MSNEARVIYKFISNMMNWENPEIIRYIIGEAFKDEPHLRDHLIRKYETDCHSNFNWMLMDIDAHCFQKFVDYGLK